MNKPKVSMVQTRAMVAAIKLPESDGGKMRAALSTETPVDRIFGKEVLIHKRDAIEGFGRSIPLTVNHSEIDPFNSDLPIGRVENFSIDGDHVMRGDLVFDTDERSDAVRGKVSRGFANDVSLTYRVLDYAPGGDGVTNITRWAPLAASIVSLPADPNSGVGRSIDLHEEESKVDTTTNTAPATGASKDDDILASVTARSQAGFKAGAAAERARLAAIADTTRNLISAIPALSGEAEALAERCRGDESITADQFRSYAFKLMGGAQPLASEPPARENYRASPPATGMDRGGVFAGGGQDNRDVQARGMEYALLERMSPKLVTPDQMKGNQFRGWRVLDVAEQTLRNHGYDTRGKSSEQIAKMAIGMRAISPGTANFDTTDFPALTENIGYKAVFDGFNTAERTWDKWCSTGSVPDFKPFTVPRISATSILPTVAENAAYTNLTRADAKESGQAVKKGGVISYSWEAIVNNDVNSFADQGASCGEAAQATIDEDVYATLLANPTMGDAVALFAAGHSNTGTAALALAGLISTRVAMGRQTDDNSRKLGIRLSHVLVPLELEDTAINLSGSEYLVDVSGTAQRNNTVRNTFTPIATHLLTDVNDWYGLARAGQTFRVVFLNGVQAPTLEQESGWDTDAMHWKVRIVFDVVPVDWRGMFRNVVA